MSPPDENPSGLGAFDLPLRLPGQYFDKETNLHYNYFRDYDPSIGRYVQSDRIGLYGGLNTYAYVNAAPLTFTDRIGWAAICKNVTKDDWRGVGRDWKIVRYEHQQPGDAAFDAICQALSTRVPGICIPMMIPVSQDIQLEQLFKIIYRECRDECGKLISRHKVGEEETKQYQESLFNPYQERYGDPVPVMPGQNPPSMRTRWGV